MAGDSALGDRLERLKAAVAAANTQALERERLRWADIGRVQEALFAVLEALASGTRPEPPSVVTPVAATAAGATVAQSAALRSGAAAVPSKPPAPSRDGLDFSSDRLEFSNGVVLWASAMAATNNASRMGGQ